MAINDFNGFKVNLTQAQYDTLKLTGTVVVEGQTIAFDENTIYHVYDEGGLTLTSGDGITITSGDTITISVSDTVAQTNKTNIFNGAQTFNGDITIAGNIYQNGTTYETHAEQLYTQKDYIVLRENATNSLGTEYSGLKIIKYNGTDDLNLVVGADGMARVGKVGDEQPLATREESPISNGFAYWDNTNNRFATQNLYGKIIPQSLPENVSSYFDSSGGLNIANGDSETISISPYGSGGPQITLDSSSSNLALRSNFIRFTDSLNNTYMFLLENGTVRYYQPFGTNFSIYLSEVQTQINGYNLESRLTGSNTLNTGKVYTCISNSNSGTYKAGHIYLIGGSSGAYTAQDITPNNSVYEELTIPDNSWVALSDNSPYTYSSTITLTTTLSDESVVELLNDQAVLFATYGFAIANISGQVATIYSIGQPSEQVTLTLEVKD